MKIIPYYIETADLLRKTITWVSCREWLQILDDPKLRGEELRQWVRNWKDEEGCERHTDDVCVAIVEDHIVEMIEVVKDYPIGGDAQCDAISDFKTAFFVRHAVNRVVC